LADAISIGIDNYKSLADRKLQPMLVRDYTRKPPEPISTELQLQPTETPPAAIPSLVAPAHVAIAPATPSPTPIDLTKAIIVP
jgi:hypothetical protein